MSLVFVCCLLLFGHCALSSVVGGCVWLWFVVDVLMCVCVLVLRVVVSIYMLSR